MAAPVPIEDWSILNRRVMACTRCPRLRAYCRRVGVEKRRAYADQKYWARPVPGFGDPSAWLWIVGLAPAAHGANRTGRMFTGDRSGDFLYAALHRAGLASQSNSDHRDDGQRLRGVYISAAARCAPPGNKPQPIELANCARFLDEEFDLLDSKRVMLALGSIAWKASIDLLRRRGRLDPSDRGPMDFAHGSEVNGKGIALLGSYHVSQQNTFTGRLTGAMFDAVLARAAALRG